LDNPIRTGATTPAASAGFGLVGEGPDWLGCLWEVCGLLWPPPAVVRGEGGGLGWAHPGVAVRRWRRGRGARAGGEFVLVPGIGRPPLVVPAGRRAGAAAVRRYSVQRSRAARWALGGVSLALAGGLGGVVRCGRLWVSAPAGADTIEAYLSSVMSCEVLVSLYLGPARANRKPVLQLLTGAGETAGFAKIGINALTSGLVRAEHESLARLSRAGLSQVMVPEVLHYGMWRGLDVLVLSALPTWLRGRPVPAARLAAAMGELAGVGGLRREPLAGSSYLGQLRSRLAATGEGGEQAVLLRALEELTARAGGMVLTFGAWHGDWAPWNMASTGEGLAVWDWERFTRGVPLGFDALHYWLQAEVGPGHRDPQPAAAGCPQRAPQLLAPFGIAAAEARVTAALYMTDLAIRYLADQQAQAGARLGDPGTWLIPAITTTIATL
jgi:Phosphotransferase enzyme family